MQQQRGTGISEGQRKRRMRGLEDARRECKDRNKWWTERKENERTGGCKEGM